MSYLRSLPVALLVVFGVVAGGGPASAAPSAARYRAIDLGTLGGPNSLANGPGITISPSGAVVESAETPALNPFNGIPGYCHEVVPSSVELRWRPL